jgi:hypothetical protein
MLNEDGSCEKSEDDSYENWIVSDIKATTIILIEIIICYFIF